MPVQTPTLTIPEAGNDQREWTFLLRDGQLGFSCEVLKYIEDIPRERLPSHIELRDSKSHPRTLIYRGRAGVRLFRLDPEQWETFREWHGPLTAEHLNVALRRTTIFRVVIGLLMLLISLPIGGNVEMGTPSLPLNPTWMTLGIGLLALEMACRTVPHRVIFAASALWWMTVGAVFVVHVINGSTAWWLVWVFFCLIFARSSWEQFRRFAMMA